MKIVVLIDQDGTVLGTMRSVSTSQPDQPSVGFIPKTGQTVQEVELRDEIKDIKDLSAIDLHAAVKKHLTDTSHQ
jgi:hypothetical protein